VAGEGGLRDAAVDRHRVTTAHRVDALVQSGEAVDEAHDDPRLDDCLPTTAAERPATDVIPIAVETVNILQARRISHHSRALFGTSRVLDPLSSPPV